MTKNDLIMLQSLPLDHLMNNMNYNYVMKLLKLKTGDELENKS